MAGFWEQAGGGLEERERREGCGGGGGGDSCDVDVYGFDGVGVDGSDGMAEDGIGKEGDLNVDVDGDDLDASWWKWVAGGWHFSCLSFSDFLTSASSSSGEPGFGGC